MKEIIYIGGEYLDISEQRGKLANFRHQLDRTELRKCVDFNKLKQVQFFCTALASEIKIKQQLQQDEYENSGKYNVTVLKLPELYFSLITYSDICGERLMELRRAKELAEVVEKYRRFSDFRGNNLIEAIANTLLAESKVFTIK